MFFYGFKGFQRCPIVRGGKQMIKLFTKRNKKTAVRPFATAVVAAALALSCGQLAGNGGATAGNSAGTGRVTVSLGGGSNSGAMLSVMPKALEFNGYRETSAPGADVVSDELDTLGQDLTVGTWTVKVEAYRTFDGDKAADKTYHRAAEGTSGSITVTQGGSGTAGVTLEPVGMVAGQKGSFAYTVTLPAGSKGTLTLKPATSSGSRPDAVELTGGAPVPGFELLNAGSYDMTIRVEDEDGDQSAGLYARVLIYSVLESKLEYRFEDADFVGAVYVSGSATGLKDDNPIEAFDNGLHDVPLSLPVPSKRMRGLSKYRATVPGPTCTSRR
jgi:hypothetical protein